MSAYKQYIIVAVLLLGLLVWKKYITQAPSIQTWQYAALTQRSDVLAKHCRANDDVCSFFPFQQGWANRLWINAIQYVWQDVYADHYEELYDRLQDVTTLDAYREYPYVFGQYLIPGTTQINTQSVDNALSLWYKWLQTLCNTSQIEQVASLTDADFVSMYYDQDRIIPCESHLLPQTLWFISFYYKGDIQQAIRYYRVAALSPWAPDILFDMPAILVGKYDDDRKSMLMRQQRFESAQGELNPELSDTDLLFILSTMQHAIRKAVHHGFLSIISEVAEQNNCTSMQCVTQHIVPTIQSYLNQCDSEDVTVSTLCWLLTYAQTQWRRDQKWALVYPLDPGDMIYDRRDDFDKRDIVPVQ